MPKEQPKTPGRYGRRRPRPGLTTASVVAAGRALIEREGLDSLTMRAVARELDTAATSLYRHVSDRDALLVAILEQVASGLPVTVAGPSPHRRLLARMTEAHDYMADHVWVLHVLIRGEFVAETAFHFAEACLADFVEAGLSPSEALRAFEACWHLILGELLAQHPLHRPHQPSQRRRAVEQLDATRFPVLAAASKHRTSRDEFAGVMAALLAALIHARPAGEPLPVERGGRPLDSR